MRSHTQKHVFVAIVRFVTQLALFIAPLHPWVKIPLILLTEGIDSFLLNRMSVQELSTSPLYSLHDKLNDLIGFVLVLLVVREAMILPPWAIAVLSAAVAYRAAQVPAYSMFGGDRDWSFAVFPDVFKELLATLLLITWILPDLAPLLVAIVCAAVCVVKAGYEYAYHVRRLFGK